MYREPKLPHVLCGLSFCEACHFVRPIPVYHCPAGINVPQLVISFESLAPES